MEKQTESKQRKALTLRQKRNMVYFVEATEKILKEEGIPGVTIRRIAAEAGYNSATLYNYFQDLDELILFGSVCFLRDYLLDLDAKKPVVYCGDLNVAHQEIDIKNPGPNRRNPGFTDEEREKMTKLLSSGFVDTFRYLYPDKTGAYSWWSYRFNARKNNAGWRIDYFIVSERLKDKIRNADIWSEVLGSDHCPVVLDLDV